MTAQGARVLVVLHEPAFGGASRAVLRFAPELAQRAWSFEFWVPKPGEVADQLEASGFVVHGRPRLLRYSISSLRVAPGATRRLLSLPGYFADFGRVVRCGKYDLVHANTLHTIPEACIARALGVPALMHVHEMLGSGVRGWTAGQLISTVSAGVLAPSRASAAALARHGLRPDVAYFGLEFDGRPPSQNGGLPIVGTVGTVCRRKGTDIFLDAVEVLRRLGCQAEFRIIGPPADGPERDWALRVLERAKALDVKHRAGAGVQDEIRTWSVFALPSREDPFPLAVLEAMAEGLAIVGTRVDGIPEQLGEEGGILVSRESGNELADAIYALLNDPARRALLGHAAKHRLRTQFSPKQYVDTVERAYERAVHQR